MKKIKIRPSKTLAAELLEEKKKKVKEYVIKDGKVYANSIDDIPYAGDPNVPHDMKVVIPLYTQEPTLKYLVDEAMSTFAKWWRGLDTDVRYYVEQRLKQKLCKDLSLNELESIMSRFQAAMKGWASPEQKNRKPK